MFSNRLSYYTFQITEIHLLYILDTVVKVFTSKKTWIAMWHLSNISHVTYLKDNITFELPYFLIWKETEQEKCLSTKFKEIWSYSQKSNLVILLTLKKEYSLKLSKYF